MKKKIIITGSTGLIGSELVKKLGDTYQLTLLTRNPAKYTNNEYTEYKYWDGKSKITDIVDSSYAVVNLLGENIGKKRWTNKQKKLIIESRQNASNAILDSIISCNIKPKLWIQASATGYYGQNNNPLTEDSKKGRSSFLANVCDLWEKPIMELNDLTVRKVIIRTGVVLGKNSELWKQLITSFKYGIAAIPGNGKQHVPWIHIDDEVAVIAEALSNENYHGVFNLASPDSCTMKKLIDGIKNHKKSFITLNIPKIFLQILLGKELTNEVILTDQIIIPQHLLKENFTFKYANINKAISSLF